jgi:transposase-like protein
VHLRTTNPIESFFATVRHRTKVTKGHGSKAAGIAMAFKLIEAAQHRWRAVIAPTSSPSDAVSGSISGHDGSQTGFREDKGDLG